MARGLFTLIGLIQGGGELLLTRVNTTIACFIPAAISLLAIFVLGRTKLYNSNWQVEDSHIMDRIHGSGSIPDGAARQAETEGEYGDMTLMQSFMPYFVLTIVSLGILLIGPVNGLLGSVSVGPSFPETTTGLGYVNEAVTGFSSWAPFTNAGTFLLIAAAEGYAYYLRKVFSGPDLWEE